MSRPMQENVQCPRCRQPSTFTVWTTLNVTQNPQQKQRLMAGELFRFTCPACGEMTPAVYPMLYHDAERRFTIWLLAPDASGKAAEPEALGLTSPAATQGHTLRAVRSVNELVGKILTFEAGLDDRVIEMIKLAIRSQMPPEHRRQEVEVQFVQVDHEPDAAEHLTFAVISPTGTTPATLPREPMYTDTQNAVAELSKRHPPPPGRWPRVDEGYVMSLMKLDVSDAATTSPAAAPKPATERSQPPRAWWQIWRS